MQAPGYLVACELCVKILLESEDTRLLVTEVDIDL